MTAAQRFWRYARVLFAASAMVFATMTADAEVHYVTQGGAGDKDGRDWDNAYDEGAFPAAILSAGAGDEIWVKAGVYRPVIPADPVSVTGAEQGKSFVLKDGVALYGGFAGNEASSADRDPAANLTVLTGDLDDNDEGKVNGVTVDAYRIIGSNSACVVTAGSGCGPTAVLDGFTVTAGNNAADGGGMDNNEGSPTVTNCAFSGNAAKNGGGMHNSNGSPIVTNCAFSGNVAVYGGGGGLYNYGSDPAVTNCTFTGNTAREWGGGMYNYYGGSPSVTNCTFSGNAAKYGGGMCNSSNSSPIVTNCTFFGNTASHAEGGGGMYNDNGKPTVCNCIFWDDGECEMRDFGFAPDVSYCVVSGDYPAGTNIVMDDPNLGPLADNGGPTKTHALLPGSSAIDKGAAIPTISCDQRGAPRPYPSGSGFDIGAYERGPEILTVGITGSGSVTLDPSGDVIGTTGKCWGYPNGTSVTLSAVEESRDWFVTWSGDATGNTKTAHVTMGGDRSVEAVFDAAWIVTVSAGAGGDITPSAPEAGNAGLSAPDGRGDPGTTTVKVRNGWNQPFTVIPDAGYSIGAVRVDGGITILGAGSKYTFTKVSADHSIEATFTANPTPTSTPTPTTNPTSTPAPTATPTPVPTPDPDIPLPTVTLTITLYAGGTIVAGPFDVTDPATLAALLSSPTLLAQLLATDPAAILSGTYNMDLVRFFSLVADLDDGVLDFTMLLEIRVEGVPSGYRAQLFMLTRTFDAGGRPTGYSVVPRFEGENVFRKGRGARGWTEAWRVTVCDGSASDGDAKRDGSVAPQIAAIVAVFPMATPTVTVTPTQGSTGSGGGCSIPESGGAVLAALLLAPVLISRRR